jgi:hypothetical protein
MSLACSCTDTLLLHVRKLLICAQLALTGWSLSTLPSLRSNTSTAQRQTILACANCQRSIGVWNFQSVHQVDAKQQQELLGKRTRDQPSADDTEQAIESGGTNEAADSTKRQRVGEDIEQAQSIAVTHDSSTTDKPSLDPILEHRVFCPWRSEPETTTTLIEASSLTTPNQGHCEQQQQQQHTLAKIGWQLAVKYACLPETLQQSSQAPTDDQRASDSDHEEVYYARALLQQQRR